MDRQVFDIAGFENDAGVTADLELVYHTRGRLAPNADNAIVLLTSYAAQDDEAEFLIDEVELDDFFVVKINMLGNGLSSSPSNTDAPFDGPRFPNFTVHDNVRCQRQLIDSLGVRRIRLVAGYSMGGLQTFEWGCQASEMIDAILPITGAAKVSPHNWLFLDGAKAALELDPAFGGGEYTEPPEAGLRAFGRVYAGWALSQTFYRERLYEHMGLETIEDSVGFVQDYFMRRDANDLLAMLSTWQHADISRNERFGGDFEAALASITCRAIVMPCTTDLYFTVADSAIEVARMPNAELRSIESDFGHFAGSGQVPDDKAVITAAVRELLDV